MNMLPQQIACTRAGTSSGTVVYPSLGSLISHERGAAEEGAPPYVLIGYPKRDARAGDFWARRTVTFI